MVGCHQREHEGAHDVVAAVAHQRYVFWLAVGSGVLGLNEGAEASAHKEPHYNHLHAEAYPLVAHHSVLIASAKAQTVVGNEEGRNDDEAEDESIPVVHHEVGYHLVHRAAVAEVGENLAAEHVVGILVVGRVGSVGHQQEYHWDDI